MNCSECHHRPTGRFDAYGMQCYCDCHDKADRAAGLFEEAIAALRHLNKLVDELTDSNATCFAIGPAKLAIAQSKIESVLRKVDQTPTKEG